MEYKKYLEKFVNNLRNVKNRSEITIDGYTRDLKEFFQIMGSFESIQSISKQDVENIYILQLVKNGNAPTSRARKISALKTFFNWAEENNLIEQNPMKGIDMPKIPHKEPKVMGIKDVKNVMAAVRDDESREAKCEAGRNQAMLALMFSTGIRRAEVTEIKLQDINLQDNSIIIHGKGSKDRIVYFNNSTSAILQNYLENQRCNFKLAARSEYLFVSKRSEKFSTNAINKIVNKYFESAGIKEKGFTAHSTRKVFATTVYKNTKDIMAVQSLLGHSNPQTTMRYIGISNYSKKKAAMSINF